MTFSLTTKQVHDDYETPYRFRAERNISIAFIFIIPFLSFLDPWLVFLTLIPWTIAGSIIIHHHFLECAADQLDAILMRDGYIEVDRYPSLKAAIHDDRFIDMNAIDSIEVIEHVSVSRRRGEEREARRLIIHLKDGKVYSIDRVDFIIKNAVQALNAWNDSRSLNINGMFKENKIDFPPFQCDQTKIGPPEFSGSTFRQIGNAVFSIIAIIALFILGLSNEDEANRNPALYVIFWLMALMMIEMMIYYFFTSFNDSLAVPKYLKPFFIHVSDSNINVRFYDGPSMSFPWSSLRGIKASSSDEWHHSIEVDPIFHIMGKGTLVFDDTLFSVDVSIANQIQSIYVKKFGFYPNRYSFFSVTRAPTTHNYSELVKHPKYGWRNIADP